MKKRFYHVNGQMMGYEEGGVKKDFLTDHLGSITAEIDQNQNRTFETRYSAYGRNNWSTGTGCGFGWVGSYGYRETGLFHMSHYVRARHYSYITGGWSTVDPLWPDESASGYVGGMATRWIDPSGMGGCQGGGGRPQNPCSKDGSLIGACIAMLCSFGSVKEFIDDVRTGIKIDPRDKDALKDLINHGKGLIGKSYSPEECCKRAHGNPPGPSIELVIKPRWPLGKSEIGIRPVPPSQEWIIKNLCALIGKGDNVCGIVCLSRDLDSCLASCERISITSVREKCKERCTNRNWDPNAADEDASGCACGHKKGRP